MKTKKKVVVKPSYLKLLAENKKLVKEISQIAIKNVELEKKITYRNEDLNFKIKRNIELDDLSNRLKCLNSTLSDNRVHFQSERAELTTALVEISNCKDLELVKEIARIALSQVNTVVRLKDTVPF
jgi:predicted RNase H-like nuclease (RuvC/YqgF family)